MSLAGSRLLPTCKDTPYKRLHPLALLYGVLTLEHLVRFVRPVKCGEDDMELVKPLYNLVT